MTAVLDTQLRLVGPCTNCARTHKECTFEWVKSQRFQKERRTSSIDPATAYRTCSEAYSSASASTASQSPDPSKMLLHPFNPPTQLYPHVGSFLSYKYPANLAAEEQLLVDCVYPSPSPDRPHASVSRTDMEFGNGLLVTGENRSSLSSVAHMGIRTKESVQHEVDLPTFLDVAGEVEERSFGHLGTGSTGRLYGSLHNLPEDMVTLDTDAWDPASSSPSSTSWSHGQLPNRKRRRVPSAAHPTSPPTSAPLWDPMAGYRLARETNGSIVEETLMKIYHDVMENALSCWLVEHTCPYESLPSTRSPVTAGNQRHGSAEYVQSEWGPNWSNRIYQRVVKLDRMAHVLGLKKLSAAEEVKVSVALQSAVMAFTSQWAQSSQRSSARWPDLYGPDGNCFFDPSSFDTGADFDRTLQISFWHQARRSLDECSDIESFRVAFAEIIFGLTQKYADNPGEQPDLLGLDNGIDTSDTVDEILGSDSQPIWVERATRRLHVLRRRIELFDRRSRNKKDRASFCNAENRRTIDLLFWLAVMFDTISAAMTERPLTVSDEASGDPALSHPSHPPNTMTPNTTKGWNRILTKDQQTKITSMRWPLTPELIAQELADAVPVKVLLYRKVTRLQTLILQDSEATAIEETIEDTLMVYRHWNLLYHPLFSDCIDNHLYLPARIQSWYVCLLGHWLLATLLIVNLIRCVDQQDLGLAGKKRWRTEMDQAHGIRTTSVRMISDLARASIPRDNDQGKLIDFHDAVNEGALLTEPWTMILIRTFSGAAITLLEEMRFSSAQRCVSNLHVDDRGTYARCEDCVKALWYLGRKSDMARQVANVLATSLQDLKL